MKQIPKLTPTQVVRFWKNVAILGKNSCWNWQRSKNKKGYGVVALNGISYCTHRIAFFIWYNKQPQNLVCHKCDNSTCCNPLHLFEGTDLDNSMDMRLKGRENKARGISQSLSKFTEKEIVDIRCIYKFGISISRISEHFKVSCSTISRIIKRKTWNHV